MNQSMHHLQNMQNLWEAVWWHRPALLPKSFGHSDLLMIWQSTKMARLIMKGIYCRCQIHLAAKLTTSQYKWSDLLIQINSYPVDIVKATKAFWKVKKWKTLPGLMNSPHRDPMSLHFPSWWEENVKKTNRLCSKGFKGGNAFFNEVHSSQTSGSKFIKKRLFYVMLIFANTFALLIKSVLHFKDLYLVNPSSNLDVNALHSQPSILTLSPNFLQNCHLSICFCTEIE